MSYKISDHPTIEGAKRIHAVGNQLNAEVLGVMGLIMSETTLLGAYGLMILLGFKSRKGDWK